MDTRRDDTDGKRERERKNAIEIALATVIFGLNNTWMTNINAWYGYEYEYAHQVVMRQHKTE